MESRRGDTLTPEETGALLRARIVTGALMSGIATFTGVAAFLVSQGTIGDTLPATAHSYLPVGLLGAVGIVLAAPFVGRAAARSARTGSEAFLAETIVKQALREGVGLAGIVFAMLAGHIEWTLAFGALSLITMGLGFPREEDVRNSRRERRD